MDEELNRVLGEAFLDGLADQDVEGLRGLRSACQAVETTLSFLRRLAQGRLDIVDLELRRRRSGGDPGDLGSLIDALPEVLSDRTRGTGTVHPPRAFSPGQVDGSLAEELATMEVDARLTDLPSVSDDWLETTRGRLVDFESRVSALRRRLLDRIDLIQGELSTRYRSGEASVDSLIMGERAV